MLSLTHYIQGGITTGFASLFIFHLIFLIVFSLNPELFGPLEEHQNEPPPQQIFVAFAVVIGLFVIAGISLGVATILSGRYIKARARRTFTMVVAGMNCIVVPYGTVLGVMTLTALSRPSVKDLYGSSLALQRTRDEAERL